MASLEVLATNVGLERFKIYSFSKFLSELRKQYNNNPSKRNNSHLPSFVIQSDVLARAVKDRVVEEIIQELFNEYILYNNLAH